MVSRTICVLPVLGVIAVSCTDVAAGWCSRVFDSGFRLWLSQGQEAFWTIRFLAEKLVHVTMFTSLGAVLWRAFRSLKRGAAFALASGWAIGCFSELFQRLFPTRDPSIRDVLINWSSVSAGVTVSYCLHQINQARRSSTVKTAQQTAGPENIGVDLLALSLHVGTQRLALETTSLKESETPERILSSSST